MTLRHISIRTRLMLAFGILLALIGAVGGIGVLQVMRVQFNANDLATNWLPSVNALAAIRGVGNEVRRASLRHVIEDAADKKQVQEDLYTHDKNSVMPALFADYAKLVSSDKEQAIYDEMRARWDAYIAVDAKQIALSRQGDAQARELATGASAKAFMQFLEPVGQAIALRACYELGSSHGQATGRVERCHASLTQPTSAMKNGAFLHLTSH